MSRKISTGGRQGALFEIHERVKDGFGAHMGFCKVGYLWIGWLAMGMASWQVGHVLCARCILGDIHAERAQNPGPDFRITFLSTFADFGSRLIWVERVVLHMALLAPNKACPCGTRGPKGLQASQFKKEFLRVLNCLTCRHGRCMG